MGWASRVRQHLTADEQQDERARLVFKRIALQIKTLEQADYFFAQAPIEQLVSTFLAVLPYLPEFVANQLKKEAGIDGDSPVGANRSRGN